VIFRDETKEKEGGMKATQVPSGGRRQAYGTAELQVINCRANSVETLLPTASQLLITQNHFYNESL
jgi:hypothetical protein